VTTRIYLNLLDTTLLGRIGVAVSPQGLLRLRMFQEDRSAFLALNEGYEEGLYQYSDVETRVYLDQIKSYLAQDLQDFSLPIDWTGYTPFQKAVLQETLAIPYGKTRSYGEVAAAIGRPKASRAVGQAEKRNDVPLVVPCHRVIGSDGSLTGYGGKDNTDIKADLLVFEQVGLQRKAG
jgi:methylated-DNA-[protein]-cysteine S-methyltransferase